ncbi:ent-kaurenoic acid oxidase 2-like [Helianthus annuus]|uniref:Ent-kaurenoic acid oxidase n=1 Tax=Helianthus annuus TaxID=4232 RepID=D8PJR7_HELAN|nr:ent-kaurenoic acid oxidase 2-like [Helianthus annuus]CBV36748.1 ent-kaurenoic acid oxidase [Helianthus annuus]
MGFGVGGYVGILLGLIMVVKWGLKNMNAWIYERKLGKKKRESLPPGDLGWPFIGNMWSFLRAFKSGDPDSFISAFLHRYGPNGIYKSMMFGSPSIIVTVPEVVRKVLLDDDSFKHGWPNSTIEIAGRKSFIGISYEEHKRLRRLTKTPINGHEALSIYIPYIETNVVSALEKWSKMGRIEFLTELRRLTFKIIMYIFLSSEIEHLLEALEKECTILNYGLRAMAINIPGFAYCEALKARRRLATILDGTINERRKKRETPLGITRKDMLDLLLECEDDNGRRLDNEEIIDTLIAYLNAGHESSGHITMWASIFLQAHPEVFKTAKEEQERIVKNMPAGQNGLTLNEYRQMEYLSKVIDETLRVVSFAFMTFREAKKDVEFKGYVIPKGWKILLWYRSLHHNPENYPQPKEFNPSRWDSYVPKPGTFLPFGGGSRLCPGNDLAKLEISIFLHHFLLKYKLERENPGCPVRYLPHPRPKDNRLGRVVEVSK